MEKIQDFSIEQYDETSVEKNFKRFFDSIPVGAAIFRYSGEEYVIEGINDTAISTLNKWGKFLTVDGNKPQEEIFKGMTLSEIARVLLPVDSKRFKKSVEKCKYEIVSTAKYQIVYERKQKVRSKKLGNAEINIIDENGNQIIKEKVWILAKVRKSMLADGREYVIAVFEDITIQMRAEEELINKQQKLINLNYHDALTDVLNRSSYNEYIRKRGHNKLKNMGVAYIDLLGLKEINELYGHGKGDEAIRLAALLIQHYFEKDEIYRLSGDEFVVIKEHIDSDMFYGRIAQLQCEFDKYELATMGALWNDETYNIEKELNKAEIMQRIAKQDYYANHSEEKAKKIPLELGCLLQDIKSGRYVMYLQPKAYTDSTVVVAAESLIRKIDRDGRIVPPGEFVPILEKARLVPYLDFFMLEETCKTLEKWNKQEPADMKISVNMSRVTLAEPDYINRVLSITDKYDIKRNQVEFEITESQETMDKKKLGEIILELADLGFGVSLDDLGTEYSSVMMLAMPGIDTVKIDRGFVLQMDTDSGKILVQHIIEMCHDLGEKCIAEGVEDDETREMLRSMGCDMYQGYLLAKPISIVDFEKMLGKNDDI